MIKTAEAEVVSGCIWDSHSCWVEETKNKIVPHSHSQLYAVSCLNNSGEPGKLSFMILNSHDKVIWLGSKNADEH